MSKTFFYFVDCFALFGELLAYTQKHNSPRMIQCVSSSAVVGICPCLLLNALPRNNVKRNVQTPFLYYRDK